MTASVPPTEPTIVVGLDETPSATNALHWAARQARLTGAVIQAIHVVDWPIGVAAFATDPPNDDGMLPENQLREPYRRGIQQLFAEVDPAPDWSLCFAVGDAGQILIRAAANAELLVIGARAATDPAADWHVRAGFLLGQTRCPVVLVPD
jgi:nucleotide-binding universal stress UspA family protein